MKERPILFSGPMVRAILDGSKTQTRRVANTGLYAIDATYHGAETAAREREALTHKCSFGQPGDRLWVRETWADLGELSDGNFERQAIYRADDIERYGDEDEYVDVTAPDMRWRPSIHMPRWACRIELEIVSVRVERLQSIGDNDSRAEGVRIDDRHMNGYCGGQFLPPSVRAYRELWESINGPGSWDANPWVWVIEFRRATRAQKEQP